MKIEGKTDIGKKRSQNEDAFACQVISDRLGYAIVCDGMGGVAGGALASQLAISAVCETLKQYNLSKLSDAKLKSVLALAVKEANHSIYEHACQDSSVTGMGTTTVAAIVSGRVLHLYHVGDSRAYLFANGMLTQLTKDHSVVQTMVDTGEITKEQANSHPRKNILSKAVGVSNHLTGDYTCLALNPGDIVLLCTDGLTNFSNEKEMTDVMQRYKLEKIPTELINAANLGGGGDNITALVIKLED